MNIDPSSNISLSLKQICQALDRAGIKKTKQRKFIAHLEQNAKTHENQLKTLHAVYPGC